MTDRLFYLGQDPSAILGDLGLSMDVSNYPPVVVNIHNWETLSIITKTTVRTILTAEGYVEQN